MRRGTARISRVSSGLTGLWGGRWLATLTATHATKPAYREDARAWLEEEVEATRNLWEPYQCEKRRKGKRQRSEVNGLDPALLEIDPYLRILLETAHQDGWDARPLYESLILDEMDYFTFRRVFLEYLSQEFQEIALSVFNKIEEVMLRSAGSPSSTIGTRICGAWGSSTRRQLTSSIAWWITPSPSGCGVQPIGGCGATLRGTRF